MGWSAMSFPGSSTLTSVEMTAIASNFYSAFNQESGSPPPTGVWSFQGIQVGSLVAPGISSLAGLQVGSLVLPGVGSFGTVQVGSGISAPQVSSFGSANVGSLAVQGNLTKQLLQRIIFTSATSRGSTSAVYSTYAVASITPVSSLSTLLIRAGIYTFLAANVTPGTLGSHLMRNPSVVASFAYLTNSTADQNAPGAISGATGLNVTIPVPFEQVDSSINLNPKQFGVDWDRIVGGAGVAITGGWLTIEEWL